MDTDEGTWAPPSLPVWCPGGAAAGGMCGPQTLARQAPSQHPPEFGNSLRAAWSLMHPCLAQPGTRLLKGGLCFQHVPCHPRGQPVQRGSLFPSQSTFKLKGTKLNSSSLCRQLGGCGRIPAGIERGPGKGKILGLSLSTSLESPPPSGVNLLFSD